MSATLLAARSYVIDCHTIGFKGLDLSVQDDPRVFSFGVLLYLF